MQGDAFPLRRCFNTTSGHEGAIQQRVEVSCLQRPNMHTHIPMTVVTTKV